MLDAVPPPVKVAARSIEPLIFNTAPCVAGLYIQLGSPINIAVFDIGAPVAVSKLSWKPGPLLTPQVAHGTVAVADVAMGGFGKIVVCVAVSKVPSSNVYIVALAIVLPTRMLVETAALANRLAALVFIMVRPPNELAPERSQL